MAKLIAEGFVTNKEIVPYSNIGKVELVDNIFTFYFTNSKGKKTAHDMIVKKEKMDSTIEYLKATIPSHAEETRDQNLLEASGIWLWIFLAISCACVVMLNVGLSDIIGKMTINIALVISAIICLGASYYSFIKKPQVYILRNVIYQV